MDSKTKVHHSDETAHGRNERRLAFVIPFAQTQGKNALVALSAVGRIESWRTIDGRTTHKCRTFALSRKLSAEQLLATVRRHWAIENNLHWQLDVLLGEDQIRSRKNNAPAIHAMLNRLAINVLQADPQKIPLSHKRLKARWSDQDFLSLLTHMR